MKYSMKFSFRAVAVLCSFCLCMPSYGAGKGRLKSKAPTTRQKIDELAAQQARLLRIQEAQQRQLQEISLRLNASRSAQRVAQVEPYAYP